MFGLLRQRPLSPDPEPPSLPRGKAEDETGQRPKACAACSGLSVTESSEMSPPLDRASFPFLKPRHSTGRQKLQGQQSGEKS